MRKMIELNIDEYGHTEGEWKVGARKGTMTVNDSNGEEIAATNSYPIARLIADAPLLLAEVQRLREGIKQMADTWLNSSEMDGREKLIKMTNQMKELIE